MRHEYTCVFCAILHGQAPAHVVAEERDSLVIVPLNPVTKGHVIVIPVHHVERADTDPWTTGATFRDAANYTFNSGVGDHNLIVNSGPDATQTIRHLHVHIVPRRPGDCLTLPWTGQHKETP